MESVIFRVGCLGSIWSSFCLGLVVFLWPSIIALIVLARISGKRCGGTETSFITTAILDSLSPGFYICFCLVIMEKISRKNAPFSFFLKIFCHIQENINRN